MPDSDMASVPFSDAGVSASLLALLPHTGFQVIAGRLYVHGVTQAALDAAMAGLPPVPVSVALWRARAALAEAGLIEAVNAGVAALGPAAVQWWEYGAEVERAHPRIAEIAAALGLTDAQIDDLFRRAAVIEP